MSDEPSELYRFAIDMVTREDAIRTTWEVAEGRKLDMPPCTSECGRLGVCFTCGVAADLLSLMLIDNGASNALKNVDMLSELEPVWQSLHLRSDFRKIPMMRPTERAIAGVVDRLSSRRSSV